MKCLRWIAAQPHIALQVSYAEFNGVSTSQTSIDISPFDRKFASLACRLGLLPEGYNTCMLVRLLSSRSLCKHRHNISSMRQDNNPESYKNFTSIAAIQVSTLELVSVQETLSIQVMTLSPEASGAATEGIAFSCSTSS